MAKKLKLQNYSGESLNPGCLYLRRQARLYSVGHVASTILKQQTTTTTKTCEPLKTTKSATMKAVKMVLLYRNSLTVAKKGTAISTICI